MGRQQTQTADHTSFVFPEWALLCGGYRGPLLFLGFITSCVVFHFLSTYCCFVGVCCLRLKNICWLNSWKIPSVAVLPLSKNCIVDSTLLPLSCIWSSSHLNTCHSFWWGVYLEALCSLRLKCLALPSPQVLKWWWTWRKSRRRKATKHLSTFFF